MNCQGDLETVQAIEKVIRGWNEWRLVKDGSANNPLVRYQFPSTTIYSRVYEVYVGAYVFTIRLFYNKSQGNEKGRVSIPDINKKLLFYAVHGLTELVDKLTPMTGEWKVLEMENGKLLPKKVS